jgi:hypothetical protein
LIDRELYLPAAWAEDEERRLLRHVPDEVTFATKPQLAAAMLHRARRLGLVARWFTGDEVYGSLELRRTARTPGFDYALAPRADHRASTAVGRFRATELAAKVPARPSMRTPHRPVRTRCTAPPCRKRTVTARRTAPHPPGAVRRGAPPHRAHRAAVPQVQACPFHAPPCPRPDRQRP